MGAPHSHAERLTTPEGPSKLEYALPMAWLTVALAHESGCMVKRYSEMPSTEYTVEASEMSGHCRNTPKP